VKNEKQEILLFDKFKEIAYKQNMLAERAKRLEQGISHLKTVGGQI
jgi:hypothetical protein